jgi:hypothetical protein
MSDYIHFLFISRRLLTDRYEWSDVTGVLERRKEGYPLPNTDWQWCGEWKVDYNTEEGTDKEGWMYALDFPRYGVGKKTRQEKRQIISDNIL